MFTGSLVKALSKFKASVPAYVFVMKWAEWEDLCVVPQHYKAVVNRVNKPGSALGLQGGGIFRSYNCFQAM